ncbi:hypothetical protein ACCC92_10855 [Mucilaginibacter sp. Mucisp84]|uniref:hypothetical protein n=1 Tax=Mucilaginibacter sp. Mucisp84 TaxID=3243058 RepID=UPI0039A5952B
MQFPRLWASQRKCLPGGSEARYFPEKRDGAQRYRFCSGQEACERTAGSEQAGLLPVSSLIAGGVLPFVDQF